MAGQVRGAALVQRSKGTALRGGGTYPCALRSERAMAPGMPESSRGLKAPELQKRTQALTKNQSAVKASKPDVRVRPYENLHLGTS